jgi:hypothetical protein
MSVLALVMGKGLVLCDFQVAALGVELAGCE